MLAGSSEEPLIDQLVRIAREPDLRQQVYERLGEYCHQCRNRLNSLKLGIYLAMKQAPTPEDARWREVDRHYQDLERGVELVQSFFRPMVLSRVTLPLDLLIDDRRAAWVEAMAGVGKALEVIAPGTQALASFDVERLGKALDLLVAWRASDDSGGRSARLRWWSDAGSAHIRWEEPAGLGRRPGEGEPPVDLKTTWTLPMLTRVALAHGGDYVIEYDRGLRIELTWPSEITMP